MLAEAKGEEKRLPSSERLNSPRLQEVSEENSAGDTPHVERSERSRKKIKTYAKILHEREDAGCVQTAVVVDVLFQTQFPSRQVRVMWRVC